MKYGFITPTYRRDFQQFKLLRHSLQRFAPNVPHLAIVQTEDRALFKREFAADTGLHWVTTAEVLPPYLERFRAFRSSSHSKLYRNFAKYAYFGPHRRAIPLADGWKVQQLTKIYGLCFSNFEMAVFLDSDLFACDVLAPTDFVDSGRCKLFFDVAQTLEDAQLGLCPYALWGVPTNEVPLQSIANYIFQPACFLRRTAKALREALDSADAAWPLRFLHQPCPSEFNLLGHFATHHEQLSGYVPVRSRPEHWHYSVRYAGDQAKAPELVAEVLAGGQGKKFFLSQSTLTHNRPDLCSVYAEAIERLFAARGAAD